MDNYRVLVTGEFQEYLNKRGTYLLHQLEPHLRKTAIEQVVLSELEAKKRAYTAALKSIETNIHACINDKYFITRLINGGVVVRKMRENKNQYTVRFVAQNFCEFTKDGKFSMPD